MTSSILVVEDEVLLAKSLAGSLKNLGRGRRSSVFRGRCRSEGEESKPDLVLMNIKLTGEMDGIEAADRIRSRFDIPVAYLTAMQRSDDHRSPLQPSAIGNAPTTV